MIRNPRSWLACLAIPLVACAPSLVRDDDEGSTVVYVPVRAPAREPAPLPSAPASFVGDGRHAVEIRQGGSVVRYEPILDDGVYDPASPSAPIDDEAERGDHESQDLPAEDRVDRLDGAGAGTALAVTPGITPHRPAHTDVDPGVYGLHLTADGLAFPYPTTHFFRGFGPCLGRRHHHEAIDLGGVGPDWGVGTPIRAMARAEVLFIGRGDENPDDFGTPDRRDGEALRGDHMLPRSKDVAPYGRVYFFTSKQGRWRSGNLIVTRVLEGPLEGHIVRYLHIAAVHPDVKVGGVIERGQEIALMGGTGVQESAPHLHLDIQAPDGHRLDVAPLLGLPPTATCGKDDEELVRQPRERSRLAPERPTAVPAPAPEARATHDDETHPAPLTGERPSLRLRPLTVARCKSTTRREDFTSGRYGAHTTELALAKGQKVTLAVRRDKGQWKPRLEVDGAHVTTRTLASGKLGVKSVVTVTASEATDLSVTIGGWGKELPDDAAYVLDVSERCHGGK